MYIFVCYLNHTSDYTAVEKEYHLERIRSGHLPSDDDSCYSGFH